MWGKSDLINRLQEIFNEYGIDIGKRAYGELKISNKPDMKTIRRRLGSWSNAKSIVAQSDGDIEIITENVRLAKQSQQFRDKNRIQNKAFREFSRIDNALQELDEKLITVLKENNISNHIICHEESNSVKAVGIVQFSDAHFNELVNLPFNTYDFTEASKRCRKYIKLAKNFFSNFDIANVLFAINGDILNSDRRLDEILNQATNRSRAMFLATDIIKYMLLDLNKDYNVNVVCVTGNESRKGKDIGYSDLCITDNYDFDIYNILDYLLGGNNGITFSHPEDWSEQVIEIVGQNILLIHGQQVTKEVEKSIQGIIGKYVARNQKIRYVLCGHLHSCRIGDTYSRSSSVVGSNAYSIGGLQLTSRASQNIHIVTLTDIHSVKIDLQDTTGEKGYDIDERLAEYHAKSADKLYEPVTIFKVTI